MGKIRDFIGRLKWYWKMLLSIPLVFIVLLVWSSCEYLILDNEVDSLIEYVTLVMKKEYLPLLIIFILGNFFLFNNQENTESDESNHSVQK